MQDVTRLETLSQIGNGVLLFPFMDRLTEGRSFHANQITNKQQKQACWFPDISSNYLQFDFYIETLERQTNNNHFRKPSIFFGLPTKVITLASKVIMYDLLDALENHENYYSLYSLPIIREDLMYLSDPEKWHKMVMVGYRTTFAVLINAKDQNENEPYLLSSSRGYLFNENKT